MAKFGGDVIQMMWSYDDPQTGSFAERMKQHGINNIEDFRKGINKFADTLRYLETGNQDNTKGRNIRAQGGFTDKEGKYGRKNARIDYKDLKDHARGWYQFKPSAVDTAAQRTANFWSALEGKRHRVEDIEHQFKWVAQRDNDDFHEKMSDAEQREMMLINIFMGNGSWDAIGNYLDPRQSAEGKAQSLIDLYDIHHYKGPNLDIENVRQRESEFRQFAEEEGSDIYG